MSLCLCVCLTVYLSVCMSVCPSLCLCVCASTMTSQLSYLVCTVSASTEHKITQRERDREARQQVDIQHTYTSPSEENQPQYSSLRSITNLQTSIHVLTYKYTGYKNLTVHIMWIKQERVNPWQLIFLYSVCSGRQETGDFVLLVTFRELDSLSATHLLWLDFPEGCNYRLGNIPNSIIFIAFYTVFC